MNAAFPSDRRILALWFPYLGTERIFRLRLGPSWRSAGRDRKPLALSAKTGNTWTIAAADEQAERLGLKVGTGVADARARYPAVEILEADAGAELRLLEALADWCDRTTPLVALNGANGLFLDISGCAHLFGGEQPLLDDCLARLLRQGFSACAGLASTPGAAWALARFGARPSASISPGGERQALAPLPLAALRLEQAVRENLESVGLRRISDVLATPRAPLARRFGAELLRRIDQALGDADEAISPRIVPGLLSAERHLAEPVTDVEAVEDIAGRLAQTLEPGLERRGEGARRLELALFRVDGFVFRVEVRLSSPTRDPGKIRRILREKFRALEGKVDAGFGFDMLRLSVREAAPFDAEQEDWLGEPDRGAEALSSFADRVSARLGPEALVQALPVPSHIPERAALWVPLGSFPSSDAFSIQRGSPALDRRSRDGVGEPRQRQASNRPLRLFATPERVEVTAEVPEGPPIQFGWRRVLYRVAAVEGPERIAPEWWGSSFGPLALECDDRAQGSEAPATRDYFRVEDFSGRRFWLFREGLYGASREPRWFLHGLFA